MTYLIDARALQDESRMRGIGSYVRGLLSSYAEMGVSDEIELLLRGRAGVPPEAEQFSYRIAAPRLPKTKRRIQPVVDPFTVSLALRKARPSLYHSPDYAQPLVARCPVVITVHDLIPFILTDYPWLRRERLLALRQLRHADALLADSQSTANDLVTVAGVPGDKIEVIPLGVHLPREAVSTDEIARTLERYALKSGFLLAVGAFDPRKRIGDLLETFARVRAAHDVELIIVGEQGKFAEPIKNEITRRSLASHVRMPGYVSSKELASLYASCGCLLFTSAYEGFGLPPLEAMAAGAPVAMYDNSSLREIAGDAAIVAADGRPQELAAKVSALLGDPAEQEWRRRAGRKWAANFTWRRTAEATFAVYQRLAGQARLPSHA